MTENVFPFDLYVSEYRHTLWAEYLNENREKIYEEHGYKGFVGWSDDNPSGYKRCWSYYEVDAIMLDGNTVEFTTYGIKSSFGSNRGFKQEVFVAKFDGRKLAPIIKRRKTDIARREFDRREDERLAAERAAAIQKVYDELFA